MSYVHGAIGLELGVTNEHDNRMNVLRTEREERLDGFSMLVILSQRIHKAVLFLEHNLGPLP